MEGQAREGGGRLMGKLVVWTALAWLSGSLMFSYWLGLLARKNLQKVGDRNPGGVNLWRMAGFRYGIAGIALDFAKGYAPVALLAGSGAVAGMAVVPIAVAPVLGHAFSPFLRGRGGKSIAVTFGVWSALTRFEAALAYAAIMALLLLAVKLWTRWRPATKENDALQVIFGMLLVFVYLLVRSFPGALLWCWLGNFLILVYTHRRELLSSVGRGERGPAEEGSRSGTPS